MSDNPTTETCPVQVYMSGGSFRGKTCGKPVKRNGKCGLHAAADERKARNVAEREAQRQSNSNRQARVQASVDKLHAAGITSARLEGRAYGGGSVWYSVTVDPAEVLRALGVEGEV